MLNSTNHLGYNLALSNANNYNEQATSNKNNNTVSNTRKALIKLLVKQFGY